MTIFFEKVAGRTMDVNPENPTVMEKYRCTRHFTDPLLGGHAGGFFDWVADNALFVIPRSVDYNPAGTLWLQDIKITEAIYARHYLIDAPYGPIKKEPGAYTLTVDLIGGTTHIIAGELIDVYPPGREGNGGLIGVDGDEIHGADVVTPEMKIIVAYRAPRAFLIKAYIDNLADLIGHFNEDTFLGYPPGEIQFLGGPFTESESEATAHYSFVRSPNATGLTIAGISGIDKKGSDLVAVTHADKTTADGRPGKEADMIEIIRPPSHSWKPFVATIGWG